MVVVPGATDDTNPPALIVATAPLVLLHAPPGVVQERAVVLPLHMLVVPVIGATAVGALTVIAFVALPDPHALVTV